MFTNASQFVAGHDLTKPASKALQRWIPWSVTVWNRGRSTWRRLWCWRQYSWWV